MHESLLTNTCLTATNRVPLVRKDLGHPPRLAPTCADSERTGPATRDDRTALAYLVHPRIPGKAARILRKK